MSFYQDLHNAIRNQLNINSNKDNQNHDFIYKVVNGDGQIPVLRICLVNSQQSERFVDLTLEELDVFCRAQSVTIPLYFSLKVGDTFHFKESKAPVSIAEKNEITQAEQAALDLIKAHRMLIKIIGDVDYKGNPDYQHIDFNLDQIQDPTANRPSRSKYLFENDPDPIPEFVTKMNLLTNKTHKHKVAGCRYNKHKGVTYKHTLKTSTSLIPTDPQYMLFGGAIGFAWDIETCNIKNKYVFKSNANTKSCDWFYVDNPDKESIDELQNCLSSVDEIRKINDEAVQSKKSIYINELLAGLPQGRIDAIVATEDTRNIRLRAWNVMLHTKEKLNLQENIPVLVIAEDNPPRVYTAAEREKDLQTVQSESLKNHSLFAKKENSPSNNLTQIATKLHRLSL